MKSTSEVLTSKESLITYIKGLFQGVVSNSYTVDDVEIILDDLYDSELKGQYRPEICKILDVALSRLVGGGAVIKEDEYDKIMTLPEIGVRGMKIQGLPLSLDNKIIKLSDFKKD
jgi:hypothetical protein